MKNKIVPIIISILILVGAFFAGSYIYKRTEGERLGFLAQDNIKLFYPDYSPVFGAKDAKVVITEFLDPECESCRRLYPEVKKVLKMYEGKVKLVVRYAAFHQNSTHAIKVLEASRKQNKYWESLDIMFKKQPTWANHHNPQPFLVFSFLPDVGVNVEQLKKDMQDPQIVENIANDARDMETLKVQGTPTFFVNGQALEQFGVGFLYSAIDREVKKYYPVK